jgi:hypothetical protein
MKVWICLLVLPFYAVAQDKGFNGSFTNTTNGVKAILSIATEHGILSGTYYEGDYDLAVKGKVEGKRATGVLKDMKSGEDFAQFIGDMLNDSSINLVLTVMGQQRQGTFARESADAIMPNPVSSYDSIPMDGKTRDASVVGVWQYQSVINSDGVNLATALAFVIEANGRYRQYSKSAGGGSDWSYDSGDAELIEQGLWYTSGDTLYLKPNGAKDYTAAATYQFHDGKLVTNDMKGQKIWYRQ